MKTALTIAGSDCSGGAGIEADIKTMTCNGVYAMSIITALTAQNTTGITGVLENTPEFLGKQLDSVFTDIFPDAVKIGMVSSAGLIEVIAKKLAEYKAKNIVIDTVFVSTSGTRLLDEKAFDMAKTRLFHLASLMTPNIPEAEILSGMDIKNKSDMENAAAKIGTAFGCSVLCKGGHSTDSADDVLFCYDDINKTNNKIIWYKAVRIDNTNTHGTGCTLSSAIASNLAKGLSIEQSVSEAKRYITEAINAKLDIGKGVGPLAPVISFLHV
jgi:hydroxymethylpyrimidine/phosphomethylpyrimidine kinase